MPWALELALDDDAAATVRGLWHELAAAGFPFMEALGANPHVSLAIWDDVDLDAMESAVAAFAAATAEIPIVLARVETFAAAGVVFLAPEASAALLEAQADCHWRLAAFGRGPWAYYAPGAWVPHCTLVQEAGAGLDRALAVARRAALPRRGRLERAELVEFRPVRCHVAVPLARRPR